MDPDGQTPDASSLQKERLSRLLGQAYLSHTVDNLATQVAKLPPLVQTRVCVLDASMLLYASAVCKTWLRNGEYDELLVPLDVLATLDILKKGDNTLAAHAREATRWLERLQLQQRGSGQRVDSNARRRDRSPGHGQTQSRLRVLKEDETIGWKQAVQEAFVTPARIDDLEPEETAATWLEELHSLSVSAQTTICAALFLSPTSRSQVSIAYILPQSELLEDTTAAALLVSPGTTLHFAINKYFSKRLRDGIREVSASDVLEAEAEERSSKEARDAKEQKGKERSSQPLTSKPRDLSSKVIETKPTQSTHTNRLHTGTHVDRRHSELQMPDDVQRTPTPPIATSLPPPRSPKPRPRGVPTILARPAPMPASTSAAAISQPVPTKPIEILERKDLQRSTVTKAHKEESDIERAKPRVDAGPTPPRIVLMNPKMKNRSLSTAQ